MKKSLFFVATAAVVLASCSNDVKISENTALVGSNAQQEIAFTSYAQGPKRAASQSGAIETATFPTGLDMMVTAYEATKGANYFGATEFTYTNPTWTGDQYWPLSEATINFLAITNANADNETGVTWGPESTNPTQKVQIVMADNSTAQRDLMYACGTGSVTQTGNALTFPDNVPMVFQHAQALVKFTVKAGDAAYASNITITGITLNSVSCQGTYVVTHTNWDGTSGDHSVAGVWSAYDTYAGNKAAIKDAGYSALSASVQDYGSLMVVPNQGIASFDINYTLNGNSYTYTYTPATTTLAQATKYVYNITLTLHEIEIAPEVTPWTEGGTEYVDIPTYKAGTARTFSIPATAGTYTFRVAGLTGANNPTIGGDLKDLDGASVTVTAYAAGVATVKFTIPAAAAARSKTITLTDAGDGASAAATTITVSQAAPVVP